MQQNILSLIGNTPVVELAHVLRGIDFRLYAKLESLNPGGSIKDRAALTILRKARERGLVGAETTIIESSSGNMGIGLAQACAYYGLRFICVVDPKTTKQNLAILKAYGAEIDMVSLPDPESGEFLQARLNRVQELLLRILNSFWPDQYSNLDNAGAHYQTMHEIAREFAGEVDYLFCTTSTCGTLRGCAEYVYQHGLKTKIYAVDAMGSVIFGSKRTRRLIPGHGASLMPRLFQDKLADRCIHVTDVDCVIGCRRLVRDEAILVGGSSGAALMALDSVKQDIPSGSTCVVIFPDRGERYLDTIYSDTWVEEHFGDISYHWELDKDILKEEQCKTLAS